MHCCGSWEMQSGDISSVVRLSLQELPNVSCRRRRIRKSKRYCKGPGKEDDLRLQVPSAQHWSRLSYPDSGISVRCESVSGHLSYERLDRFGQQRLMHNIKKNVNRTLQLLRIIHRSSVLRLFFRKWRRNMEYSVLFSHHKLRNFAKSQVLLRSTFLAWKYLVTMLIHSEKSLRIGVLALYSVLHYCKQKKLKLYFRRWRNWNKYRLRIMQKTFDYWSIFTYKKKLASCNAMRFVMFLKNMSMDHTFRKRKGRIKFYFNVWRDKNAHINNLNMKRRVFTQWCAIKRTLLEYGNSVSLKSHIWSLHTFWKQWRLSYMAACFFGGRYQRLKYTYFKRWNLNTQVRKDVKKILSHYVDLVENSMEQCNEVLSKYNNHDSDADTNVVSDEDDSYHSGAVDDSFKTNDFAPDNHTDVEDKVENNEQVQRKLFEEKDNEDSGVHDSMSSSDAFSRLKLRVSSTHDFVQKYEERRVARAKKTNERNTKLRKLKSNYPVLSRNSKNFNSDYS